MKKVLVLGSGALKIGEAGEFDYSGSQAIKALHEEGIETILVNPNIATVQTSKGISDRVYFLPITPDVVERVLEKERPDGILLSFGGQTALNCGIELYKKGILDYYHVSVLGTPIQTIIDTEDRELFVERLKEIGVQCIESMAVTDVESAINAANRIGFPIIVRAAYALGGLGSGFCDDAYQLRKTVEKALSFSPQILIEKSLKGWKEIEYEVVRDKGDNCIAVCNMENFDPLGIHTGDSIVVAPSQTLSNYDCRLLHSLAIKIVRHLGVVGECNLQFAYDSDNKDYKVIEVNARLSRSSALASKATGYPLAFVAAKLAIGYNLTELRNMITQKTTSFYEPTLDYVVCKVPRWDLGKFHGVNREIGSSMKSVGEVMAIGRTFEEALQKGLRMVGIGMLGFVENSMLDASELIDALERPKDNRIFAISTALQLGYSIDKIYNHTKIDKWFLSRLKRIVETDEKLKHVGLTPEILKVAKQQGFSDMQISLATGHKDVREIRKRFGILPYVKQIDACAAEFQAKANYLYLTYNGSRNDLVYEKDQRSVIVLGSGAYSIGSSVEFDWCGVQTLNTIRKNEYRSVMINCNPETVSTDYDQCDRLYFEELSYERVLDIVELEQPHGVIISAGGQIPNNLAVQLAEKNVNVLGTKAQDIDRAEDRYKFSAMLDSIGVAQPQWSTLTNMKEVQNFVKKVGFPVLVRPSYVLSGAAMHVCWNINELEQVLKLAINFSNEHPVVISKFVEQAKEVEMDAVAADGKILAHAISEHIEFAGVHSGDATLVFPAQRLSVYSIHKIEHISKLIAKELHISGPFNIQFLVKGRDVMVIECNLRASRSFPFVSKVMDVNLIDLATYIMLGNKMVRKESYKYPRGYIGVKASQFSFNRLQGADPIIGVDMASTGEVGCFGESFQEALLKAMLSVSLKVPQKGILISIEDSEHNDEMIDSVRILAKSGYLLYGTIETADVLNKNGINCNPVYWSQEEGETVFELIHKHLVDLVINISRNNLMAPTLTNGYQIRRAAVDSNVPLLTNAQLASAFIDACCKLCMCDLQIKARDEYN